jgi:diaminohydroxyphosphoribosylaminopyrimidine deaminase/5-amino-6-(5-phosphoribosylamino)uracil reductase
MQFSTNLEPLIPEPLQKDDADFMAQALRLAHLARLNSHPNPAVGCLLVRQNEVIAKGYTQPAGQAHAEVMALRQAGQQAHGSTAYVTLEPCNHHGRTPPCSEALINAGISRLVYCCVDPNPQTSGQGQIRLAEAGIKVSGPLLESQCRQLNSAFMHRMQTGKSLVISKLAISLDGRTAMASGESQWITGTEARAQVHLLRAQSCALVTGIGSVLQDNPAMIATTSALLQAGVTETQLRHVRQPLRVVLDSQLRLPTSAKILQQPASLLVLTCSTDKQRRQALEKAGAEVVALAANRSGQPDLKMMLKLLEKRQCNQVMIEAGAHLNGKLLKQQLLDQLVIFMAPVLLGATARPMFDLPLDTMSEQLDLHIDGISTVGKDWRIDARPA